MNSKYSTKIFIKMVYYLIDKIIDKPIKNIKIIAGYMLCR